jgi:hypothetical protein
LAFDSEILDKKDSSDETKWGTSISPWQLWMKHRRDPGRGINGKNLSGVIMEQELECVGIFFVRERVQFRTMGI